MSKKIIISLILVLSWMALIFYMSSHNAYESGSSSRNIVTYIISKFDQITNASKETINYHQSEYFLERADHIFRKMCHFGEYSILGILLINFFFALKTFSFTKSYVFSLSLSIAYSISDEFHQTFVNGRSGQVSDVLLDTLGAIVGISILSFIYYEKYRKILIND